MLSYMLLLLQLGDAAFRYYSYIYVMMCTVCDMFYKRPKDFRKHSTNGTHHYIYIQNTEGLDSSGLDSESTKHASITTPPPTTRELPCCCLSSYNNGALNHYLRQQSKHWLGSLLQNGLWPMLIYWVVSV